MSKKPITRTDRVLDGDGKYYYAICKCGEVKEYYKSSYCKDCQNQYQKRWRKSKPIKETKVERLELEKVSRVITNSTWSETRRLTIEMENSLIKFVNKIDRRRGVCSLQDIFVEMIDLYNFFGNNSMIDTLPTQIQLSLMWDFLKNKKKKIENKKWKKMTFET